MATKNVCNFEKFGYCRNKEKCKDYHPTEVCKNKSCRVSRCRRRHPKICKFFESGYCKFKESCKYDHKIKVDDLLEKIMKLEKQNKMFRDINEQQENSIHTLNERLSHVEIENKSLIRKLSKQHDENKSSEVTLVTDDSSRKRKFEDDGAGISENDDLKKEIEFSVDVETKVKEIKDNMSDKSILEAKLILKKFQHHVNQKAKTAQLFSGKKTDVYVKLIDNFNIECNQFLVVTHKTSIFRSVIPLKLQSFLKELIEIRNFKKN